MVNFPFSWRTMAIGILLVILVVVCRFASYYHDKYITADSLATERQQAIDDMTVRQRDVAALDAKYTKELADAKAIIGQLHDDVASGKRRLQLNATCTKQSATASTGMDDAATARLTDSAQRDYFTLRERIEVAGKQIAGLQQYINEQCLR
ncbi:putative murein endopeptidase; DLP12 prophage [Pantoea brenneri]|uniref:Murein endopeptidase DLP12 prophage n=2 Tax=Pantoea brenneri TaxID=472694 RepID=A0AAX3J5H1_9GAMM|nr:putative murein endopeptidase; DLP12 prophage [Pantoea brenneri]